jgi:hypothetical protein
LLKKPDEPHMSYATMVNSVTPFLRATARTSEGREEEEDEETARGELELDGEGGDLNVVEIDNDDNDEDEEEEDKEVDEVVVDDDDDDVKRIRLDDGLGALNGGIALKSEALGPPIAPAPELLCKDEAAIAEAASAPGVPFPLFPSEETVVDSASSLGSIVLRTTTGTPANAAGRRHLGCNTFAPIAASSCASL